MHTKHLQHDIMAKSKDSGSKFDMTPLGEGYTPTNFDVVCARGRIAVRIPCLPPNSFYVFWVFTQSTFIIFGSRSLFAVLFIQVNHTGNKRFKLIVESSLQRYSNAATKLAKSAIGKRKVFVMMMMMMYAETG